jgi:hypothetical protein
MSTPGSARVHQPDLAVRRGSSTGQDYVSATVKGASGKGVGAAIVRFTTTTGAFADTPITTDGGGLAQASLTTTGNATITASVGSVSRARALDVVPTVQYVAPPSPVFPAPPAPPPPPATPVQPPGVATVGCRTATGAVTKACNVSVVYNNQPIASTAITRVDWDWGDGTVVPMGGGSRLGTHVDAQAGAYRVGVTVSVTVPLIGPIVLSTGTSVTVPGPAKL